MPSSDFSRRLIHTLVNDDAAFRDAAANELTTTYNNDGCNGGAPISKEEFARRLSLIFVLITGTDDDCFGSVTYNADGMFTEHTVHLMVDKDGEIEDIEVS